MLGTGEQHWSNVHVADLAEVFGACWKMTRLALLRHRNGLNPTVTELTEAAAVAAGRRAGAGFPRPRLGRALATILPRCCCSIRHGRRQGPAPNSVGQPSRPSLTDRVPPGQLTEQRPSP